MAEVLGEVRRRCPDLPVMAIPWMHAKHPVHRVQQQLIEEGCLSEADMSEADRVLETGGWRGIGALVAGFGLCLAYATYLGVRLVQLRFRLRRGIAALKRQRFDVVAKTWNFGPASPATEPDFYYGDLQRRLAARGLRMLLLCGNADGQRWSTFARSRVSTADSWRLPEMCLVHPLTPYVMVFEQLLASVRLRRLARRAGNGRVRRASELASKECLSRATTMFGLFFWIGRNAVKIWHPRALVSLYEGHGWEKCAWWGAKTADESCKTVGYQHTVIFPQTISLLRPHLGERPELMPDIVLCLGENTRRMIEPGHRPRGTQLITFGSFRRTVLDDVAWLPRPHQRTVLVLPEGHLDQEELLFGMALRVAALMPDHHFILRCHPFLPFRHVRPLLERAPEELPNIEVSSREAIGDDFARSSVVLYRGSSAALYAVLHGLKPIYLQHTGTGEVDALFELTGWRERAESFGELREILRRYATTAADRVAEEWAAAAEYVKTYAFPVDDASVDRFLRALDSPNGNGAP